MEDDEFSIVFGKIWDGEIEAKFHMKSDIYSENVQNTGSHLEEWSVIEIKKYKMKEIHADLEEAALQIKEFRFVGNPGRELMTALDVNPMLKQNIRKRMKKKPLLKPVIIRTPIATRLRKRINN